MKNLHRLVNTTAAEELKEDLLEDDDSKRKMKSLDAVTANQIFKIFGVDDPNCDESGDGKLTGLELRCLNKIWKYYIPNE